MADLANIIRRLTSAVKYARSVGQLHLSDKARAIWERVYADLSEGKPGMFGSVTSRAEAQVMRLACIYALLARSDTIKTQHLKAALAVWRYCENSARFIFGATLGDPVADEILRVLRQCPDGMTRDDIREYFKRNKASAEIGRALGVLLERELAYMIREDDGGPGRPTERWFATSAAREKRGKRGY